MLKKLDPLRRKIVDQWVYYNKYQMSLREYIFYLDMLRKWNKAFEEKKVFQVHLWIFILFIP